MTVEARPFYLYGRKQLDALGARVQRALPALAREWWAEDSRIQLVGVSMCGEELRTASLRYVLRGERGSWLALLGTERAWLRLAESWLGCEVPVDGPLIGALRREFCVALYRHLAGTEAAAVVLEQAGWSDIPADSLKPGGGALLIELDVEGIPLTLLAPVSLWPELASWPPSSARAPLERTEAALSETVLDLEARLPGVHVPMTDMGALAVGDFLDLRHDLSGRVRVLGAEGEVDVCAVLGQHEGRKAVRIEPRSGAKQ